MLERHRYDIISFPFVNMHVYIGCVILASLMYIQDTESNRCHIDRLSTDGYDNTLMLLDEKDLLRSNNKWTDFWLRNFDYYYREPIWEKTFSYLNESIFMGVFSYGYDSSLVDYNRITFVCPLLINHIEYKESCNSSILSDANDYIKAKNQDVFEAKNVISVTYHMDNDELEMNQFQLVFAMNESVTYIITTRCDVSYKNATIGFDIFLMGIGYYRYCPFDIACGKDKTIVSIMHNSCTDRPVLYPYDRIKTHGKGKVALEEPFLLASSFTDHIMLNYNGVVSISSSSIGVVAIPNNDTVLAVFNNGASYPYGMNYEYKTESSYLEAATNDISKVAEDSFSATQVIIISYRNFARDNIVQAVLASNGFLTYVILNYYRIVVEGIVGYSEPICGSEIFYNESSSRLLMHTSNIGVPGRHVFLLTRNCSKAELYPYGEEYGDAKLPYCDECAKILTLKSGIPLSKNISELHIHNDGFVSEDASLTPVSTNAHETNSSFFIVAPYYGDFDTTISGTVYYRETNDAYVIGRANADVKSIYIYAQDIKYAVIVTYVNIAEVWTEEENTFQVVIAYNENRQAYVIINYKHLSFADALAKFQSQPCSYTDISSLFQYDDPMYLTGNARGNKLGKYVFHLNDGMECKEVCSSDKNIQNLMMLNYSDIEMLKELAIPNKYMLATPNKHMVILSKIYPYVTDNLYMAIHGQKYDRDHGFIYYNLTVNHVDYIETCNLNMVSTAREYIMLNKYSESRPTRIIDVTYHIADANIPAVNHLKITFAIDANITYILASACDSDRVYIHVLGYFKKCSFTIICDPRGGVAVIKLDHDTCIEKIKLLYPQKQLKANYHYITEEESRCSWKEPFLLFSTYANSLDVGHGYITIQSKNKSSTEYRSLWMYDVFYRDDDYMTSSVFCEYSEQKNLLTAADMDISTYTSTDFFSQKLLIITFHTMKMTTVVEDKVSEYEFIFQAVIATNGSDTYAILNYAKLDRKHGYVYLEEDFCSFKDLDDYPGRSYEKVNTSNVGIPGRYVYHLTSKNCKKADFYPYGKKDGDAVMKRGDNIVEKLTLTSKFTFNNGKAIPDIYLSTNGLISTEDITSSTDYFNYSVYPYTIIAPYNLDFDTNLGGTIYYRQTNDTKILLQAQMDIESAFTRINFSTAIIATYFDLPLHDSPHERNTFQVVIAHDGANETFLILTYKRLESPRAFVMFSEAKCCNINIAIRYDYGNTTFLTGHTTSSVYNQLPSDGLGKYVINLRDKFTGQWTSRTQKKIIFQFIGFDFIKFNWKYEKNNSAIVSMNVVGEWYVEWKYFSCDEVINYEFQDLMQNKTYKIEVTDKAGNIPAKIRFSPEKLQSVSDVSIKQNQQQATLYWKTPVSLFGNVEVARTVINHTFRDVDDQLLHDVFKTSIYESQYIFNGTISSVHTFEIHLAIHDQLSPVSRITYIFTEESESSSRDVIIIGSSIGGIVIVIFIVLVSYYKKKMKRRNKFLFTQSMHKIDPDRSILEQCNNLTYDMKFEFPRKNISLFRVLGEGAFGQVWMASAKKIENFKPRLDKNRLSIWKRYGKIKKTFVAVKTLKGNATEIEYKDLANELKLLIHLGEHRNIVNLLGACTRNDDLLVILEYCSNGALLNYLRLNRDDFEPFWHRQNNEVFNLYQITWVAVQIADGMHFLEGKKCIHRDLAARNVLLTETLCAKIADFGLARDTDGKEYYKKESDGNLPIKWMAPEAITDQKYTSKSDVWSFGILLWEIYSLGSSPYPTIKNSDVLSYLKQGQRMAKPQYCADEIYELMLQCWSAPCDLRPTFLEMRNDIDQVSVKKEQNFFGGHTLANVYNITSSRQSQRVLTNNTTKLTAYENEGLAEEGDDNAYLEMEVDEHYHTLTQEENEQADEEGEKEDNYLKLTRQTENLDEIYLTVKQQEHTDAGEAKNKDDNVSGDYISSRKASEEEIELHDIKNMK